MSNREMLYRSVLRHGGTTPAESPSFPTRDLLSPMSSLALNLHHTASLSTTPRRKLSMGSNISDSPSDLSFLSSSSFHESTASSEGNEDTTLMSPPTTSMMSPSPKMMVRDKENCSHYSPSHKTLIPYRPRSSPLQDVQNTVNRNLTFSPMKKKLQMISPTKQVFSSPHKPSPPDDFDTNSQDSGYSESGKKFEDTCFSVPVSCAPRKLNLDLSPPKVKTVLSPLKLRTVHNVHSPPKVQSMLSPQKAVTSIATSALAVMSAVTGTTVANSDDCRKPFRRFNSLIKPDEEDTMLMDLMNETPNQEDQPLGFSSLLSAPIHIPKAASSSSTFQTSCSTPSVRPAIKRCLSMMDITPTSSRVECMTSHAEPSSGRYGRFKRPEAPADLSNLVECKKRREEGPVSPLEANARPSVTSVVPSPLTQRQASAPETTCSLLSKPKIVRSHSESHVSIMKALNKCSSHNGDLTGDFSKPVLLPIIGGGKHPDLKAISVDTMSELLQGKYASQISSYKIVDCRYPYEFEGGHINGAEMFHHPKMIIDHLTDQKGAPVITQEGTPRHILIFHCEFSAERGPKAQRLLREMDRTTNKEHYPALYFPETYLLEGGYKAFFEKYPEFCTPKSYVRMLDSNHAEDLKHFRGKSKSWQAENKQSKSRSTLPRTGLKRLGVL